MRLGHRSEESQSVHQKAEVGRGSHFLRRLSTTKQDHAGGSAKLASALFPHGEVTSDELAEMVEIALEGRRRVKEQLKKMGSFEYHQTSFSYIDNDSREGRFVGVPEQGGCEMISTDPLAPGSIYTACVDDQGKVGLYRLEVGTSPGTDKLKIAGGPENDAFEKDFASFVSCPDAVAVNSGSSALELCAILSRIGRGDEVILPAHTFVSSAVPFGRTGATLKWADI